MEKRRVRLARSNVPASRRRRPPGGRPEGKWSAGENRSQRWPERPGDLRTAVLTSMRSEPRRSRAVERHRGETAPALFERALQCRRLGLKRDENPLAGGVDVDHDIFLVTAQPDAQLELPVSIRAQPFTDLPGALEQRFHGRRSIHRARCRQGKPGLAEGGHDVA